MTARDSAKDELQRAMRRVARDRDKISYSDLVAKIKSLHLEPDSSEFHKMLDEISWAEAAAKRGMLSAVVVHKTGDLLPGPGFFDLANRLGRGVSSRSSEDDRRIFHAAEVQRVWDTNSMSR